MATCSTLRGIRRLVLTYLRITFCAWACWAMIPCRVVYDGGYSCYETLSSNSCLLDVRMQLSASDGVPMAPDGLLW